MSILKIKNIKDPILRGTAKTIKKVDKRIIKLIGDMKDTLLEQRDPEGVGLAAPQIGKPIALCLVRASNQIIPMINPQILWFSKETNEPPRTKLDKPSKSKTAKTTDEYIMEGCLSLPNYYGPVRRSASVRVRYQTPRGETVERNFSEFVAQIIQHEVDHLQGKVFIDRLFEQKRKLFKLHGSRWQEVELP